MVNVRAISLVFTITLTAASLSGQTVTTDSKSEILGARAAWNKSFANHDAEALSGFVTPDFTYVNPLGQYWGMTAVKHHYEGLFKGRPDVTMIWTPSLVAVVEGHGLASEEGKFIERWTARDGITELRGGYFTMWKRINGTWKQQADLSVPESCKGGSYCSPISELVIKDSPENVLSAYPGLYVMTDGSGLEIRREGKNLVAQGPLIGQSTLVPKSADEFSTARGLAPILLRFRHDAPEGSGISLELTQNEKRIAVGQKLKPSLQMK